MFCWWEVCEAKDGRGGAECDFTYREGERLDQGVAAKGDEIAEERLIRLEVNETGCLWMVSCGVSSFRLLKDLR